MIKHCTLLNRRFWLSGSLDMIWYDVVQYDGTEDKLTGRLKPITYLNHHTIGADSGSRTHTMFPSKDFESFTSAYSITSAYLNIFQPAYARGMVLLSLPSFKLQYMPLNICGRNISGDCRWRSILGSGSSSYLSSS